MKVCDLIKKNNLKTFTSLAASLISITATKTILLKSDKELFARLLLLQQKQEVSMEEIPEYYLTALPFLSAK